MQGALSVSLVCRQLRQRTDTADGASGRRFGADGGDTAAGTGQTLGAPLPAQDLHCRAHHMWHPCHTLPDAGCNRLGGILERLG